MILFENNGMQYSIEAGEVDRFFIKENLKIITEFLERGANPRELSYILKSDIDQIIYSWLAKKRRKD